MKKAKKSRATTVNDTPNVLLIEDRAEDAELTRAAFLDVVPGWIFHLVRDGIQATNFIRAVATGKEPLPDLILLDLNLPHKDGRKLLTEFKKDPLLTNTPIIVMTGSRSEADIEACHLFGAASFVFKPMNWDQYRSMAQFIREFWHSHASIPPVWINSLGSSTHPNDAPKTSLMAATHHLVKATMAADDEDGGLGWKQVLLITMNLKWAWESLTMFGEEEIRADTGVHHDVEREAPWFIPRLKEIERQLLELEGMVADLAYSMEGLSKSKKRASPQWLRSKLEGLLVALKNIISQENRIIVDQFVDMGTPG